MGLGAELSPSVCLWLGWVVSTRPRHREGEEFKEQLWGSTAPWRGSTGMGSTGLTHNPSSAWKENTENSWSCWASPARQTGGLQEGAGDFWGTGGILGMLGMLGRWRCHTTHTAVRGRSRGG